MSEPRTLQIMNGVTSKPLVELGRDLSPQRQGAGQGESQSSLQAALAQTGCQAPDTE